MTRNPKASRRQLEASDPDVSAWVNANAGSGKTHVLVDRVIRLLLGGTEPSRIMCLTFTKAAAAEMSNRLFDRLGEWVSAADEDLVQALQALGAGATGKGLLQRARQLFTRALETPGGLKIQTIHAFCERVLHLFPIEAGVMPDFAVMDEQTSGKTLQAARDEVLAEVLADPGSPLAAVIGDVARRVQADDFENILRQILSQRASLHDTLAGGSGIDEAILRLRGHFGLGDQETEASAITAMALDPAEYLSLAGALASGSTADIERGARLRVFLRTPGHSLLDLRDFYITQEDNPRALKYIATKRVVTANPWVPDFVASEQVRLLTGLGKLADLESLSATRSLLEFSAAILRRFEQRKRQQALYDFDDLIIRTGDLLSERPDAAWVLYKLDGGIDHLLIDEAQDTSPAQWRIATALTQEFFAGEGSQGGRNRTVFAVGDRKQSIYSFQGADPDIFESVHDDFAARITAAGKCFRDVDFTVSFRSAPQILAAVDTVFRRESLARQGLDGRMDRDWSHESNRRGAQGVVELWPLVEPEDDEAQEPWTAPVDREPARSPRRRLAARLAGEIGSWIGKRKIVSLDRPVQPGDILVLVRVRNGFFDALIRELRLRGIPVAGADRLKLTENLAVLDLLALARFCIMPEDDYSLACVLKSPVFAAPLSEDMLMSLAIGRGAATLWDRLRHSQDPICAAAATQLGLLMATATSARPFEFFSGILVNARLQFLSRLGSEAGDAMDAMLDAALAFEETHGASLAGFVNWFASGAVEIKRNMEQAAGEVRIMTVHGAKGLEAPIVILPDTVSMPDGRQQSPLLMISCGPGGAKLPFWPASKNFLSTSVATLRSVQKDLQAKEYRRLLYVAMTRARDELYICGYGSKVKSQDGCWYNLVATALNPAMPGGTVTDVWRIGPDPVFVGTTAGAVTGPHAIPGWVGMPAKALSVGTGLSSVSSLSGEADDEPTASSRQIRMARGLVIHRILQNLQGLPDWARRDYASRIAGSAGYDQNLADEVIALTHDPGLRDIFREDALTEIPMIVDLPEVGGPVSGRIDRLVIADDHVLAVDFKTGRQVPEGPEGVDLRHLRQMAAYRAGLRRIHPGLPVRMALLYTERPVLIGIPDALLDRAYEQLVVSRT